jgi:hypothetical protein
VKAPRKWSELENAVRQWLLSQHPTVKFLVEPRGKDFPVDFLLTNPAPVAIEVTSSLPTVTLAKQGKRMLARRISLAERFGPAIPLIVIMPPESVGISVPFADLTVAFQKSAAD